MLRYSGIIIWIFVLLSLATTNVKSMIANNHNNKIICIIPLFYLMYLQNKTVSNNRMHFLNGALGVCIGPESWIERTPPRPFIDLHSSKSDLFSVHGWLHPFTVPLYYTVYWWADGRVISRPLSMVTARKMCPLAVEAETSGRWSKQTHQPKPTCHQAGDVLTF